MREDMAFHRPLKLPYGCPGPEVKRTVEREEIKLIAMDAVIGGTRAPVACPTKIIAAFERTAGQLDATPDCFGQRPGFGRQIEKYPMDEGAFRRIAVGEDQGKALGFLRHSAPSQGRGYIWAVAGERWGDAPLLDTGALEHKGLQLVSTAARREGPVPGKEENCNGRDRKGDSGKSAQEPGRNPSHVAPL